jgi:DNA-directed RNA polymerase subunit H (RpoH/RPB5)
MMRDRGGDPVVCKEDFVDILNDPTIPIIKSSKLGVATHVFICPEERIGVKYARSVVDVLAKGVCVIFISIEGPTPFTRKEFMSEHIQFILAKAMCVNITKHSLVPKHEVMKSPPKGVAIENLAMLHSGDPIAQYYNWPPGTIVRTWRAFAGDCPIPYFRVVVDIAHNL